MGDLEFQKKMALQFYYMGFYTDEQLKQFVPYLLSQDDYNTAVKNKHPEQSTETPQ
ncbi:XkdX family protein [Apilactobacillus micheneri]|uniref:XkdX family protein n=1 Tax=Apilactobacillus micheneri TaxID=1899430 RepID=UPI00112C18BC|nr:XkdX family protein [Apilactobacillus micheneri]TPR40391.1 XkdX family protein [Apilactobacillus micheneri]